MSYINRLLINGIYQGTNWVPNVNTKAYYPLSDDTLDYSGNAKHLISGPLYDGITTPSISVGKFGNARYFNGSTDLLWYSGNTILTSAENFTMSAWILYVGDGSKLFLNNGDGGSGWSLGDTSGGLANGVGWLSVALGTTKTWSNIIMTRGSGTITFYLNGQPNATTFSTVPNNPTGGFTTIGGTYGQTIGWEYYNGSICEVILENICWQAADVLSYYNQYK